MRGHSEQATERQIKMCAWGQRGPAMEAPRAQQAQSVRIWLWARGLDPPPQSRLPRHP